MALSKAIEALKLALKALPGVGPKNAQRMAFYLMERDREGAKIIAQTLLQALEQVTLCDKCNTFCESALCHICSASKRESSCLCIVETPADLEAIEQIGVYQGLYFVLMGKLSPLEGIGPEKLAFDKLQKLLTEHAIDEVIIATNNTVEGDTTADYIQKIVSQYAAINVTKLARGVPVGGELEYLDQRTLAAALNERKKVTNTTL